MKPIQLALPLMFAASVALAENGVPGSHFIENWDLDGDGQVTLAEAQERRGDVFYSFDADEDGYIDGEEYKNFDEARKNDMEGQGGHGNGAMKNAEGGMHLAYNDADSDGRVSRAEFLGRTEAWIGQMDRNGDGVVTTVDFGRK